MRIIYSLILLTICSFAGYAQPANNQTPAKSDASLFAEAQAFEKELLEILRKGDRAALEVNIR